MSANTLTDEFKRDSVGQVEDRGYPVREVADRLGVSTKPIYTWRKQVSLPAKVIQEVDALADEICRLKCDVARVTNENESSERNAKPAKGFARTCSTTSSSSTTRSANTIGMACCHW